MIKIQDLTPSIYYNESRDFQFIGRLYDVVLNYLKTNADLMYLIPSKNTVFIDLLALTLGLNLKHKYNTDQLMAICSVFTEILRNKGTLTAVQLIGDTILHAEGITDSFEVEISDDGLTLDLYIPIELTDLNLFNDLLEYVLPAGITCNKIKTTRVKSEIVQKYDLTENIKISKVRSNETARIISDFGTSENPISKAKLISDKAGYSANTNIVRPNSTLSQKVSGDSHSEELYKDENIEED